MAGFLAFVALAGSPALAEAPPVQSQIEALAQDGREYAARHGVTLAEAMARLRAQEESVAATDRVRVDYRDRLAGIAIEHAPEYRIVVLLTGEEPVPDQRVFAGGMNVPIVFRTGAAATGEAVIQAIRKHQAAIRKALPHPPGLGLDPRTGELVVTMWASDADTLGRDTVIAMVSEMTGVPVRIRTTDRDDADASIEGGARVEGVNPADGKRYSCTTGFIVRKEAQTGVATAAHCPDDLTYIDKARGNVPLEFVGQWGWSTYDVQIHLAGRPLEPFFYADPVKNAVRPVTSWRNRASTRAGDVVCHRGERTGYSCAEVELVDYAPPGDLCGGPCEPTWVTVAGPRCRSGDSGGPVFNGTIAFGLLKGASYRDDGGCNFYFYMSTDFLPDGWSLLYR